MTLCTNGSCNNYQHMVFTLSLVTHAGSSGTTSMLLLAQAVENHCPIRAGEEAEESGKTLLLPTMICAALPNQQLVPDHAVVRPTLFTHLRGPAPVTGLFVQVAVQGAVKISTLCQKWAIAELQSQVCPKVRLWWLCLPKKSYFHIIFILPAPNLTRLPVNPSKSLPTLKNHRELSGKSGGKQPELWQEKNSG